MTDNAYSIDLTLLSLCAIMISFDHKTLEKITVNLENDIQQLITSSLVSPASDMPDRYYLRADVREHVLAVLRSERPVDELRLHTRLFAHFSECMQQKHCIGQAMLYEQDCFYHLDRLFFMLSAHEDWATIMRYTHDMHSAATSNPQHIYRLVFYEGHVALKTQNYDQAYNLLTYLIDRDDLDNEIRTRALNALAVAHMEQSHYDQSLQLYQQVYTLACETHNLRYQGAALLNMSLTYHELDYYEQAIELTTQSIAIFRELGDKYGEVYAIYELGNSSLRLGRLRDAQSYFKQSIALCTNLQLQAHLAYSHWGQGLLYHLLGKHAQSEIAYLSALTITQSDAYNNPKLTNDILWYLGFLYATEDRWEQALSAYNQALALATELRRPHYISLILYQKGNLFKRLGRVDETMEAYQQAIETIERLRGATEGEEIKIGLLGTTQQIYESMVLLCLEHGHPDEAFAYVERARSQAFLDTLAKKDPELYAKLDRPVVTLRDVQQQLPADALLIEYFTTGVLPRGEHMLNNVPKDNLGLREHLTLPPQVIMFAITRDHCEVHQLDRTALDPNALRPKEHDPDPSRRLLGERMLTHLYARLIEPVAHLLQRRSLLYLIPHGPLHSVPFMALRSATGSYLLDRSGPAVALAPSATVLLHNCLGRPVGRGERFVALGYDHAERGLRYTEVEAQHVARLMDGEAWTGPASKSEDLFASGPHLRWLHIASHASYNPRAPLDSELYIGADDRLSARTIIARLHLQADGVTLSACTSGLSHVVAGDEQLGLQRAWLYAGAPTVVCTLWETADLVALLVMERFYTALREGCPAAAALRDAQVAVRELTMADLAITIERWRSDGMTPPDGLNALEAKLMPDDHTQPFADPHNWAPFMLIGRPA